MSGITLLPNTRFDLFFPPLLLGEGEKKKRQKGEASESTGEEKRGLLKVFAQRRLEGYTLTSAILSDVARKLAMG